MKVLNIQLIFFQYNWDRKVKKERKTTILTHYIDPAVTPKTTLQPKHLV